MFLIYVKIVNNSFIISVSVSVSVIISVSVTLLMSK